MMLSMVLNRRVTSASHLSIYGTDYGIPDPHACDYARKLDTDATYCLQIDLSATERISAMHRTISFNLFEKASTYACSSILIHSIFTQTFNAMCRSSF
ncbi:hypothetical protein CY34DRAFT_383475 [Suillus luteus UH-Slu-Lm8-n1]|uniref:Uncharacterized protein n=1 Tax=Suillus luteus UH-Slu-Lm8-n1 TaxID=930992 RepID=A0A0D0A9Z5_9AGAM|nr:hypothetical protein CY34DRAFT_383475 [Suillus luteus UH-Slu-Lm8-n1]